ncbi:MAG: hypothetical protein WB626_04495 [Bacteroidota bacterium]
MAHARGPQKVERLTITLLPTSDERSFRNVPSTFNTSNRTYAWRQMSRLNYMLVPRKISGTEIKVDIYVNLAKKPGAQPVRIAKLVQDFVEERIQSEWRGLRLAGIARAGAAQPPLQAFRRGTIEEMLGATLEG